MSYRFAYPTVEDRDEEGFHLVLFPDVPEAGTSARTASAARRAAADSLIAGIGGSIKLRRDIPRPSRPRRGQHVVALPPLVAAKLALYQAMRESGVGNAGLARRLKVSQTALRRLLDLDRRSHISEVEAALSALGKRLVIDVRDAA